MSTGLFRKASGHRALLILAAAIAALLGCAVQARADSPIVAYSAQPSNSQAGGHPDLEVYFETLNRIQQHTQTACDCEDAKDSLVELPQGFIGNPHAAPQCSIADFSADTCPIDSQIGTAEVKINLSLSPVSFVSAIYNVEPPPDDPGLLGFKIALFDSPVLTVLSGRTGGDFGLDSDTKSIFHLLPLVSIRYDLWGVPASPAHDRLRFDPSKFVNPPNVGWDLAARLCDANGVPSTGDPNTIAEICPGTGIDGAVGSTPSNSQEAPFLQNPTVCDTPLTTNLEILSYDGGVTDAQDSWPEMTGCDQLSFNPSLYAQPTTTATDSPSGIEVDLSIPQQVSATVPSPTELKATTVTLPEGFSINPNAADGKVSCTDAEARFQTDQESHCPELSKVGSLTIDSSALPGPLPGYVYLGQPEPGNRYRIFLVANGFNTHIKLAGTATPNPQTGQLVISFQELPQTPLTAFNMHFFGSERGLLATPTQCGTYPVTTTFTPWDSSLAAQSSTQYFTLESGPNGSECPAARRPFSPGFEAAAVGNTAGAHSPFSIELTRGDGEQDLSAVNVTPPAGLLATLAGIPYCSDAALVQAESRGYTGLQEEAHPSCPAASQVGTAMTAAGAGNHPVYVAGKVFLAGPYKGAPLSLAVITPAISGPYDLGNVVVRAALRVDPETARITAASDPLPRILEGIPLRLRSIRINLDRPNFTLNPTRCDPFAVTAELFGDQGAVATPSERFQVANCATLSFAPTLALSVSGNTKRIGTPALTAVLTQGPGQANIGSAQVSLPKSEQIDQAHINTPCTRVQFAAEKCPAGSLIGNAKAETPLLEKPLQGPVYLRSAPENKNGLPDVVAVLKGQIEVVLDGKIDTVGERLRTTFKTVPDAPVSKFTLHLDGGQKGLLLNTENLCKGPKKAAERIDGQNGKSTDANVALGTPCGKKPTHKRHRRQTKAGR